MFPEWLKNKIGEITPDAIIRLKVSGVRKLLKEYFLERWPSGIEDGDRVEYLTRMSKNVVEAMKFLEKHSIMLITMFENGEYRIAEVYFLLGQISGISSEKATMVVTSSTSALVFKNIIHGTTR